ncbi:MAG: ABC transporter ATP-binding protein, partial [Lachnospiraceae bacterium]|nr:ABC transporter ATP-binding protein [Lachnospiraceae bacterium]
MREKEHNEKKHSEKRPGGKIAQKIDQALGFHKTGLELLKIAHGVDSSAIPLRIISSVLDVAGGYLGLFLTARLIDLLLAGKFREGMLCAALLALSALLLGFVGRLIAVAGSRSSERCEMAFAVMLRRKAAMLDFETMEQPQVTDKIFLSERAAGMYGGLEAVLDRYQTMLGSVLDIGAAIGLIMALCLSRPASGHTFLALAAHPAVSAVLVIAAAGVTVLAYRKQNTRMASRVEKYRSEHAGAETQVSYMLDRVLTSLQAAKVVRIYDMKGMMMHNVERDCRRGEVFYAGMCDTENQGVLGRDVINGFFVAFSYLFVAVKALAGAVTVGAFTQYAGAMTRLSEGFLRFGGNSSMLRQICIIMQDFLELMKMESSHQNGTIPVEKRLDGEYEIAFCDVSFHYPGSEDMILKHVNCKINMKNKLALVGKNGAGKTTFVKLLCRLYEPTEGMITLNGIDIRKYKEEEYRELFGVVFQDFKLFAFPLWQNVAAGYKRDEEKLRDSLERAGAAEFVENLPQGVDTLLFKNKEGGTDISGGEAQKLALARALYKDAPFVVLDEPTAALDPISEAQVYEGFHEMVKDKTSIYISHRMSSCRFCDDIVVFDQGRIAERGSHEQLLKKDGAYA